MFYLITILIGRPGMDIRTNHHYAQYIVLHYWTDYNDTYTVVTQFLNWTYLPFYELTTFL